MASNSTSQLLPVIGSAPLSHSVTATGNSRASRLTSALVSNYTINQIQNGDEYPLRAHRLSFTALLSLFKTIISPLVERNHHFFLETNNNRATLDTIIDSVAYECVIAAYSVMYNKASRISGSFVQLFGSNPTILTAEFPTYCTALINAIGPIQFSDVPARGLHVPYLKRSDITAGCPAAYAPHYVALFKEQTAYSVAMASVDTMVVESSPWWTFHAYPTNEGSEEHASYILYSPVRFDGCENSLKLGVLFAREKLTMDVGVINHSATPYYLVKNPDKRDNFPAESKEPPHFIKNQSAYYEFVEPRGEDEFHTGSTPTVAESSSLAPKKKRRHPAGTNFETNEESIPYRRVYYYFDHIAVVAANNNIMSFWAAEINAVA